MSKFFTPRATLAKSAPNATPDRPTYTPPTAHQVLSTALHPAGHVVAFQTKASDLMVGTQETVLSWDTIEGLYLSILNFRLQERGLGVSVQQLPMSPSKH